ncbi:MAG: flagellar hook-basal body complex protein FliE [bacterium]
MTDIAHINSILPGKFPALEIKGVSSQNEVAGGFGEILSQAIEKVQALSKESDSLQTDLALGRPVELHQVMLAATKAGLALDLLIEIRNKILEAYQEISRMSV